MGFDQYHEPANELSQKVRTFARMITSLIEEAEAIGWYEQRISVEKDPQAKARGSFGFTVACQPCTCAATVAQRAAAR